MEFKDDTQRLTRRFSEGEMRVLNTIGPRVLVYPDMKHKPTRDWILGKRKAEAVAQPAARGGDARWSLRTTRNA